MVTMEHSKRRCANAICPMSWRAAAVSGLAGRASSWRIHSRMPHGTCQRAAGRKWCAAFVTATRNCGGAAELTLFGYGPTQPVRAICATTDPCTLPELSTWYLTTNLSLREAPLADIVHLYGLRNWIEEGYKRMKDELGWADFMVRSDRAIRRHWTLVCCAFAFCWWHEAYQKRVARRTAASASRMAQPSLPARKKNPRDGAANVAMLATRPKGSARLAGPGTLAHTLLERLLRHAPAFRTRHAARRAHGRSRHQPLSPALTN